MSETTDKVYGVRPLLVVKIGSKERPADAGDFKDMKDSIEEAIEGNGILVTHHDVKFETIYIPTELDLDGIIGGNIPDDESDNDESAEEPSESSSDIVTNLVRDFMNALSARGSNTGGANGTKA